MTTNNAAPDPLVQRGLGRALVTGASSGIGRAVAVALAAAGAQVLAVARDRFRLDALAADAAGSIEAVAFDLADDAAILSLATRVAADDGTLRVLVHAAGDIAFGTVAEASPEGLDLLVAINLRAPYRLTHALLPLLEPGRGHIVFLNSSAGVRPSAGVAAYGATKHALRGLADALRDEVNPLGIRVTSIYPGRTRTPMQDAVRSWEGQAEEGRELLDPADVAAMVLALLSLPPRAEVTDLHIRPAAPLSPHG